MNKITPVHVGEILLEEFMQPYGFSQNVLAKALHVTWDSLSQKFDTEVALFQAS